MPTTRARNGIVRPSIRATEAAANAFVIRKIDTIHKSPAQLFSKKAQPGASLSDFTEEKTDGVAKEHLGEGSDQASLLSRIRAAISYTRKTDSPLSCSHFTLPTSPMSPDHEALQLLRSAHASDIATFVCGSDNFETYALAVKPIYQARLYQGGGSSDAQWWMGMSRAQQRAGPGASGAQIKRAEALLKEKDRKRMENDRKGVGRSVQQGRKLEKALAIQETREGQRGDGGGLEK
ncbi:hypothetical protein P154DRAFT_272104 [Amniculicola lignicola CBS 123094]|uniref:Uncharacterized protein n=1 Tax=Amniculicola lignicola CBS 123094 TaxID=1392246 RepID=A0A6A5WAH7_9PLEO|nr:hypothetical protein P154DRAFT_272104 [Amniculicola lignicola CBS 123094]